MNKETFYDSIRHSLFGGKLIQSQVNNIEAILNACAAEGVTDEQHIAYILATAYHECFHARYNHGFDPIREGFANTDQAAINHVTSLFKKKAISKNYALPAANGKSFFGRGYVQITWDYNYRTMGKLLGIDLYNHPDLALRPEVAAKILVKGMKLGTFTGKKLSDYFYTKADPVNARRIINGTDKAELIAGYSNKFYQSLV